MKRNGATHNFETYLIGCCHVKADVSYTLLLRALFCQVVLVRINSCFRATSFNNVTQYSAGVGRTCCLFTCLWAWPLESS